MSETTEEAVRGRSVLLAFSRAVRPGADVPTRRDHPLIYGYERRIPSLECS